MRPALMRRHEHTLYAVDQEEIGGSSWIGYCVCGAIFKAPTESEVRDAHRHHKRNIPA